MDNILKLPRNIRGEIIKHVTQCGSPLSYRKTITFDLDKRTFADGSPVLASVCRKLRRESPNQFQSTSKCVIKMASKDKRTNFERFRKLGKFWCIARSAQFPWRGREQYTLQHLDCLLEVEAATTLESLRINITHFLRITSTAGSKTGSLTISAIRGQDGAPSNASTSFEELRWYVLIALTEFTRKHPDANRNLCPNIWINGLGQVVEIESADTTMDVQEYIRKYTPWNTHRRAIFREYSIPLRDGFDYSRYTLPAEAFDGSARFYISWLQRCGLGRNPECWSDAFELLWDLLLSVGYADCYRFPDSGCVGKARISWVQSNSATTLIRKAVGHWITARLDECDFSRQIVFHRYQIVDCCPSSSYSREKRASLHVSKVKQCLAVLMALVHRR